MATHKTHIKRREYDGKFEVVEWRNLGYLRWVCVGVFDARPNALEYLQNRLTLARG